MLRACSRCGKIHKVGYKCRNGVRLVIRNSDADKFRNTQAWKDKTAIIKARDYNMCRICERMLYNTKLRYNSNDLSVHHIVPLAEDFDKRLDDENLITLCSYHHELAEKGQIPRALLMEIAVTRLPLGKD